MCRKGIFVLLIFVVVLSDYSVSYSQSLQIANGLNYLTSTQNPDGSWGGTDTSISTDFYSTAASVEVQKILNETNLQAYTNAVQWLSIYPVDNAGYIAWKILALQGESIELTADLNLLLQWQKEDGGWGGYEEYFSNNYHTSHALQALKAVNYPDQNVVYSAINYLKTNQNPDGGWGLKQGDDSEVYYTALVLNTLSQFKSTYDLQTEINNAVAYLLAHQNPDGSFGDGTVYETALSFIALIKSGSVGADHATVLQKAIAYLTSTQLPNGSWNDDPYSTALALRALANIKPNLPKMSSKEFNNVWRHIV